MQIRQFISRNQPLAAVIAVLLIALGGWALWRQSAAAAGNAPPNTAYYTTDDGKTWFTDDVNRLTPFEKDGKEAVKLYMFRCPGTEELIPGYLERYTARGREVTERYNAERKANPGVPPKSLGELSALGRNATEVKKPGGKEWVPSSRGIAITQVKCDDGTTGVVVIRPQ